MDVSEQISKLKEFIELTCHADLLEKARTGEKFLIIDFSELTKFDPELADLLLETPEDVIKAGERAIEQFELPEEIKGFRLRIRNLPKNQKIQIKNIRSEHLNKLISIEGLVRQKSDVRPQVTIAKFECPECGNTIPVIQTESTFKEPTKCSCGRKGRFKLIDKELIDAQKLVIEESPEDLEGGEQPKRINVILKGDLVSPLSEKKTNPGSKVEIIGMVKEVPIIGKTGTKLILFDLMIDANYVEAKEESYGEIEIKPEEEIKIKEIAKNKDCMKNLVTSIAPSIYGHDEVKEALLLQMLSGVRKKRDDGTIIRGDIHVLLLGDPGCISGESQVALAYKGMEQIKNLGATHLQPIKEIVTRIRRNANDKPYDFATRFHYYRNQPVLKLKTETGKEVICTYNQPFLTREGWKRADEILPDEEIRVMPKIPNIIKKLAPTEFTKVEKKTGKLKDVKIPENFTPELASLCGYIIGDGHINKRGYLVALYVNEEEKDLVPQLFALCQNTFNITPSINIKTVNDNMRTIDDGSGLLRQIISTQSLCVLELNSRQVAQSLSILSDKRVPQQIFKSPKHVVARFVSWLFEADGCAFGNGRGRTSIQLKSKTKELLQDVQLLLLYFGIQSRIIEDNLCIQRSRDMELFAKYIGFNSTKKKEALNSVLEVVRMRNTANKRKTPQKYERVAAIAPAGVRDVYDFEVPVTHMFIANGIVCHNSGKSQLLKRITNVAPKSRYVSGKGASGAGLCVSPNSLVLTNPGGIEAIQKIVDARLTAPQAVANYAVKQENITDIKIQGLSRGLKIQSKEPQAIWKLNAPKEMIEMTLSSGKKIEVTANTQLLTMSNGKLTWKKSSELIQKEYVATPRCLIGGEIKTQNTVDLIKSNPVVLKIKPFVKEAANELAKKNGTLRIAASKLKIAENSLYHNWVNEKARGNIKLKTLQKICEAAEINWKNHVKEVSLYNGKPHTIPTYVDKELLYIAGLIAGDGDIRKSGKTYSIRLSNSNITLHNIFRKTLQTQFGLHYNITVGNKKRPTATRTHSKILAEILDSLGIPESPKSNKIKLSNITLHLSNELLAEYLAGLYDADGSVSIRKTKGSNCIDLTTCSEMLARQLQLVLLRYEIHAAIRTRKPATGLIKGKYDKWVVEVRGLDCIKRFSEHIKLRHPEKKDKLSRLANQKIKPNTNIDMIPTAAEKLKQILVREKIGTKKIGWRKNLSRCALQEIVSHLKIDSQEFIELKNVIFGDIFWEEIKEIYTKKANYPYVYDLTMQDTHNFVVDGILVHNTAAVVKDEFLKGWSLEAGALTLTNKGLCAVDEFDKMTEEDRDAMHEALEQQSYHPEFEIMFSDGSVRKIGEFVDGLIENSSAVIKGTECEILDVHDYEVLTTDFNKIYPVRAAKVSRHKAPSYFIEVEFFNGRKIIVTPEHPFFVYKNKKYTELAAEQLRNGMFVPAPRKLPVAPARPRLLNIPLNNMNRHIVLPENVSSTFSRFLGYLASEGNTYFNEKTRCSEVGISNTDPCLIQDINKVFSSSFNSHINLNVRSADATEKANLDLTTVRCCSAPLYKYMKKNFEGLTLKAPFKYVPNNIRVLDNKLKLEFLRSSFNGDGFVDSERFGYSTSSFDLARGYGDLLLMNGIWNYVASEHRKNKTYYKVIVSGHESMRRFLKSVVKKNDKRSGRIRKFCNRSRLKLNDRDLLPTSVVQEVYALLKELRMCDGRLLSNIKSSHNAHVKNIGEYVKLIEKRTRAPKNENLSQLRWRLNIQLSEIAQVLECSRASVYNYEKVKDKKYCDALNKLVKDRKGKIKNALAKLKLLIYSDIRFTKIKRIKHIKNKGVKWTYDVTVEPNHAFVSEGLILHNTVSIAKANIQATLRAETTVLAAANPKLSRFDLNRPIGEQINLPSTIISRFDLIFPIKDIPNKAKDEKMAEFILTMHQDTKTQEVAIETELLRKYIAYAKQRITPKLTKGAFDEIKEYYVSMRGMSTIEGGFSQVTITARQLEALVRLSEASAKAKLSDKVTRKDAQKAKDLVHYSLSQFGMDKETGRIDIDRIITGVPASQRNKIMKIKEIIEILEQKTKPVPIEDVIKAAEEQGISRSEVEETIQKLIRSGDVYEPRKEFIQKL